MPHICPRCKRANPDVATYCYFDGFVLQSGAVAGPAGQLAREFVFPTSGRRCQTVEDISLGCQIEWNEARELLRRGEFERFFGQTGRLDLSRTAQEAQASPDADMALFQFVNNLPAAPNPQAPRLDLTPRRISLGSVKAGDNRQMKITVINQGKGLLLGKVAVTDGDPWLKLVDGNDPNACPVKATRDQEVTVRVESRGLIAGQGYSGKLTVVTNGGIAELPLRLNVAAVPFGRDPFKGATSPRGMAERMRASPKPAVPLLESGEVAKWFAANGWKYPVAGTPARGIGGIQQFFECLGLSKPPPVMLSETELRFQVTAPEVTRGQVALRTTTKKWVYAQVDSDAPWLRATKPSVSGPQQAQIGFEIDSSHMDGKPHQEAMLRLIANGGQRLALKVRVSASFPRNFVPAPPPPQPAPSRSASFRSAPPAVDTPPVAPVPTPAPIRTAPTPAINAAPPLEWLPQPVEKPRRPESLGVKMLRPLVVGVVLALVFRLVIAAPAEIFARVVASGVTDPKPGSVDCWRHSPLGRLETGAVREEKFLKWFVMATWWVGGVVGAWLVWRRGGHTADTLFGGIAGAAGGLPAAATAACLMVVLDTLPRALYAGLTSSGSTMSTGGATFLWLMLAGLCWAAFGAGLGYLLCALGRGGSRVLWAMAAPLSGLFRACGMRGMAELFAPE